jgi:Coenzyme PQQ synthesis protein D (PqqD)
VFFQEIEGETMLLDDQRGLYFELDVVATRVWQLLNEDGDLATVAARMLAEFEVDEATLNADLADLFAHLTSARLVVRPEQP